MPAMTPFVNNLQQNAPTHSYKQLH